MIRFRTFLLAGGLTVALFPAVTMATLGESATSVERDSKRLHTPKKVSTHDSYTVHDLSVDGAALKEYLSTDGVVFAVTWGGYTKPAWDDLCALFGSYCAEYATAVTTAAPPRTRKSLTVQTSQITVVESVHSRDMHGIAFVRSLVPEGVDVWRLP